MSSQGQVPFMLIGCVSVLFIFSCMYLINPNYIHIQFTGSFQPIYMDLQALDGQSTSSNNNNEVRRNSQSKGLVMSPQTGLCRFTEEQLPTLIWSHRAHQEEWHLTSPDSPQSPLEELQTLLKHGIVNYDIDISFISKSLKEKSDLSSSFLVIHPTVLTQYLAYEENKRKAMLQSVLTLDQFLDAVEEKTVKRKSNGLTDNNPNTNTNTGSNGHSDGHLGGDVYNANQRAPLISIELKFNSPTEVQWVFEHILNKSAFRRKHVIPITSSKERLSLFEGHMSKYMHTPTHSSRDGSGGNDKKEMGETEKESESEYVLVINSELQRLLLKNGYPAGMVHTGSDVQPQGAIGLAIRSQGLPVSSDGGGGGGGSKETLLTMEEYLLPNWSVQTVAQEGDVSVAQSSSGDANANGNANGNGGGGGGEGGDTGTGVDGSNGNDGYIGKALSTPPPTSPGTLARTLPLRSIGSHKTSYSRISTAYYGDGTTQCCTSIPYLSHQYQQVLMIDKHLLEPGAHPGGGSRTTKSGGAGGEEGTEGGEARLVSQWKQGRVFTSFCHRVGSLVVSWVVDDVQTVERLLMETALDGVITNKPIYMLKEVKEMYKRRCR